MYALCFFMEKNKLILNLCGLALLVSSLTLGCQKSKVEEKVTPLMKGQKAPYSGLLFSKEEALRVADKMVYNWKLLKGNKRLSARYDSLSNVVNELRDSLNRYKQK